MDSKIHFSFPEDASKRQAFRAHFAGLCVIVLGESFEIHDLSTTGLSFTKNEDTKIFSGYEYSAHLAIASRIYIADLSIKIVRINEDFRVACCFADITMRQEARLDKLLLEMQKRAIAQVK